MRLPVAPPPEPNPSSDHHGPTNVIEMVLDQTDNPVLRAADLPFHPPQLTADRCEPATH